LEKKEIGFYRNDLKNEKREQTKIRKCSRWYLRRRYYKNEW
jgi:hypothetical protein